METIILSASANRGVGLWTSICMGFSAVFGFESKAVENKKDKVLEDAQDLLESQFDNLGIGWELRNISVAWNAIFSVTLVAIAVHVNADSNQNISNSTESTVAPNKSEYVAALRNILNGLYENKDREQLFSQYGNSTNTLIVKLINEAKSLEYSQLITHIRNEINIYK